MIVLWMWFVLAFGQDLVDDNHVPAEVIAEVSEPSSEPVLAPTAVDLETVPSSVPAEVIRPVLPWLPMRGFWAGVFLSLLALTFGGLAVVARPLRHRLAATGLLPTAVDIGESVLRVLALFFGLGALAAWIPGNLAPLLPWVMVFGAAAAGWSLRDVAPDLMAWMAVTTEGRIRVGRWLEVDGFAGRVESVGLRCIVLHDLSGREITVPNRQLIRHPVEGDLSPWPLVEVELVLPVHPASKTRRALREAVLLSPWIAPGGQPEISGDTHGDGRWRIRTRLIDGRFAPSFRGTLRERVLEVLDRRGIEASGGSTAIAE